MHIVAPYFIAFVVFILVRAHEVPNQISVSTVKKCEFAGRTCGQNMIYYSFGIHRIMLHSILCNMTCGCIQGFVVKDSACIDPKTSNSCGLNMKLYKATIAMNESSGSQFETKCDCIPNYIMIDGECKKVKVNNTDAFPRGEVERVIGKHGENIRTRKPISVGNKTTIFYSILPSRYCSEADEVCGPNMIYYFVGMHIQFSIRSKCFMRCDCMQGFVRENNECVSEDSGYINTTTIENNLNDSLYNLIERYENQSCGIKMELSRIEQPKIAANESFQPMLKCDCVPHYIFRNGICIEMNRLTNLDDTQAYETEEFITKCDQMHSTCEPNSEYFVKFSRPDSGEAEPLCYIRCEHKKKAMEIMEPTTAQPAVITMKPTTARPTPMLTIPYKLYLQYRKITG